MDEGNRKMVGGGMGLVGAVLILLGVAADAIGLGDVPGIGWKQMIMLALGVVAVVAAAGIGFGGGGASGDSSDQGSG